MQLRIEVGKLVEILSSHRPIYNLYTFFRYVSINYIFILVVGKPYLCSIIKYQDFNLAIPSVFPAIMIYKQVPFPNHKPFSKNLLETIV